MLKTKSGWPGELPKRVEGEIMDAMEDLDQGLLNDSEASLRLEEATSSFNDASWFRPLNE